MFSLNSNSSTTQGFKKKSSNVNSESATQKSQDKLGDLRLKLQKQKESMMRKTGKRFKQEICTSKKQIVSELQKEKKKSQPQKTQKSTHEICIGPQQPLKQSISLKDLSLNEYKQTKEPLQSSRIFEREIKNQKKRSNELIIFLKNLQLDSFAQSLISNGFDDLQTISSITTEDLNMIMMRAPQQIRLFQALKVEQKSKQTVKTQASIQQFGTTSSLWRLKTEPMQSSKVSVSTSQLLQKQKKQLASEPGPKLGSFLYSVGAKNWSTEDQIRRACSVCFKVEQQMNQKGTCFYCSNCYKYVSEDVLNIQLGINLNRNYGAPSQ